jgi:hypothetical protein
VAKTLANVRIYGDETSAVYVAPESTTLPTTLAAPSGTFVEVGWLSEDGVDQLRSLEATTFKAWQGGAIVRRKKTSVEDSFKFVCLEETATVLGLVYAGQTASVASSVATITVTDQTTQDDRAFVIDWVDGDITKRACISSGAVEMTGTVSHKNADMTMYEFTVTVQGDWTLITDNPAVTGA